MPASSGVAVEEPQSFQVSTKNIGASLSVHSGHTLHNLAYSLSSFIYIFLTIHSTPSPTQNTTRRRLTPDARRQMPDTRRQMETEGHLGALTGWGPRMCVMCLGMMNSLCLLSSSVDYTILTVAVLEARWTRRHRITRTLHCTLVNGVSAE